jgi:hypothetical protein
VLTSDELATAHGFPRQLVLPSFPVVILEYPPCQVLSAILDPVWETHEVRLVDENPRPIKRPKDFLQTYIPSLKRHLSHDWIDVTLITATASKADDASLPCRMWDSRLELLFPGCLPALDPFRLWCLKWQRRRLIREIRTYMSEIFGPNWVCELLRLRQLMRFGSLREHKGGLMFQLI